MPSLVKMKSFSHSAANMACFSDHTDPHQTSGLNLSTSHFGGSNPYNCVLCPPFQKKKRRTKKKQISRPPRPTPIQQTSTPRPTNARPRRQVLQQLAADAAGAHHQQLRLLHRCEALLASSRRLGLRRLERLREGWVDFGRFPISDTPSSKATRLHG